MFYVLEQLQTYYLSCQFYIRYSFISSISFKNKIGIKMKMIYEICYAIFILLFLSVDDHDH